MRVLAIDFGTSNTVGAVKVDGDPARVLSFGASIMLPSAVFAAGHGLVVGAEAIRLARSDPTRFEPNPKRRIDDNEVLLGSTVYPIVDLISAVLRAVATESLRQLGRDPDEVRLTHPANWGTLRRSVLITAARRAGLGERLVLVPEPVAAAARFAQLDQGRMPEGGTLAVYDLGGGTFDVALVRRSGAELSVLASDGRADIGGIDFDHAILDHLAGTAGARNPEAWEQLMRPAGAPSRRAARALREDVQRAKESLTDYPQTEIPLPPPLHDALLTRPEFGGLIRSRVAGTVGVLDQTVRDAGLRPVDLAGIFLVGGASRVPLVSTEISDRLGVVPVAQDQPETAVVLGALAATPSTAADNNSLTPGEPTPANTLILADRAGTDRAGTDRPGTDRAGTDRAGRQRPAAGHGPATDHPGPNQQRPGPLGQGPAGPGGRVGSGPRPPAASGGGGVTRPVSAPRRRRTPAVWAAVGVAVAVALVAGLLVWRPWQPVQSAGSPGGSTTVSQQRPVLISNSGETGSESVTESGIDETTGEQSSGEQSSGEQSSAKQSTGKPTTSKPTTSKPTTSKPTTSKPTTSKPTTSKPTTAVQTADSPLLSAVASGQLRIGIRSPQPEEHFELKNTAGELARDFALELGGRLGVRGTGISLVRVTNAGQASDLIAAGEIDLWVGEDAWGEGTIWPVNHDVYAVGPWLQSHWDVMVAAGGAITAPEQLDGKTLCQANSQDVSYLEQTYGISVEIVQQPSTATCVTDVAEGKYDAVFGNNVELAGYAAASNRDVRMLGVQPGDQPINIMIADGDQAGGQELDVILTQLFGDGTWAGMVSEYLTPGGYGPPQRPDGQ